MPAMDTGLRRYDRDRTRDERSVLPSRPEWHDRTHRDHRRRDDLSDDGLHRLRQPGDPRRIRHGQGRGVRRDLPCLCPRDAADGAPGQLSAGAGAGDGDQRLFHLRRGQGAALQLGGRARRGVPVGMPVPDPQRHAHPIVDRRCHPPSQKMAISAGIGLFLGIIALKDAGLIAASPDTLVSLGDLKAPTTLLACAGFLVMVALDRRAVPGAIIIAVLGTAAAGILLHLSPFYGIVARPPSLAPTFLALDLRGALDAGVAAIVFVFLFVDLFDNTGTLIGVAHRAGLLDRDGRLPRAERAFAAASLAAMGGALLGTSTVTSYIESAAGVKAGGRTGLTGVTVAALFLLTLFLAPLAQSVPTYAIAPALLFVACLMARGFAELDWDDVTEYAPAVVTALAMPLTFSIANGIALGFISYAAVKLLSGRFAEASPSMIVLALLFIVKYAFF